MPENSTPVEVSDHGYLTSSFYVEETCVPPVSTTAPIVPFSKIPSSLSPVQTTSTYTSTHSGVTAEHQDTTTIFRIPIVTIGTTSVTEPNGHKNVVTTTLNTVSHPVVDVHSTTTIGTDGIPTVHQHTSTVYEIPTEKEHSRATTINGVKTESHYTTTSYIYPEERMNYT
jgi:hypothetical protein